MDLLCFRRLCEYFCPDPKAKPLGQTQVFYSNRCLINFVYTYVIHAACLDRCLYSCMCYIDSDFDYVAMPCIMLDGPGPLDRASHICIHAVGPLELVVLLVYVLALV